MMGDGNEPTGDAVQGIERLCDLVEKAAELQVKFSQATQQALAGVASRLDDIEERMAKIERKLQQ